MTPQEARAEIRRRYLEGERELIVVSLDTYLAYDRALIADQEGAKRRIEPYLWFMDAKVVPSRGKR